jgi:hypothetical protein
MEDVPVAEMVDRLEEYRRACAAGAVRRRLQRMSSRRHGDVKTSKADLPGPPFLFAAIRSR